MKKTVTVFFIILFLIGCKLLYKPQVRYAREVDFRKYRTYGLLFDDKKLGDTLDYNQAIGKEIIYQMSLRGYKESFQNPEIVIHFELHPETIRLEEFEMEFIPRDLGSRMLGYSRVQHRAYNGTLIIRVYELKTKDLIMSTYVDHLNRYGQWDDKFLRIKTKNLLIKYPFRKV